MRGPKPCCEIKSTAAVYLKRKNNATLNSTEPHFSPW